MGSNRGAYIRMGHDLIPHFVQYQASKTCRELTLRQRYTRRHDIKEYREKLKAGQSYLFSTNI